MPQPGSQAPETPKGNTEAPRTEPQQTEKRLEGLRTDVTAGLLIQQIREKNAEGALTTMKTLLLGPNPKETVDGLFEKLKSKVTKIDFEKMVAFCTERGETNSVVGQLLGKIAKLSKEVGGDLPEQILTGTRKVKSFINELVNRVKPAAQQLAARFNYQGEVDGALQFLADMLTSKLAAFIENTAMSFKSVPKADVIFQTAFELRRDTIKDQVLLKKYKTACDEWLKGPKTTPPPTPDSVAQESAKPTEAPKQQPQQKPAEAAPQAPAVAEKVESSKKIELEGGKWITFIKEKDKAIVEIDKGKRQIKFNGQVPEVAVIKPSGTEKGKLEVKANGQTATFDLLAMHKSLTDNPTVPEIVEGNIKINLEPA